MAIIHKNERKTEKIITSHDYFGEEKLFLLNLTAVFVKKKHQRLKSFFKTFLPSGKVILCFNAGFSFIINKQNLETCKFKT